MHCKILRYRDFGGYKFVFERKDTGNDTLLKYGSVTVATLGQGFNSRDFKIIDCYVMTVANSPTEISGAPKSGNWIPLTIVHEGTLGCIEHIMRYGDTWHIYSTVAQGVTVRFFKYPI